MGDQVILICRALFQKYPCRSKKSYLYYTNYISPLTMLLSVWCVMSNASVIIALFRSGINSIRPGLLMLCSLTLNDLLVGALVGSVNSSIRIKHLLNSQVCDVYSKIAGGILLAPTIATFTGTFLKLSIISIDRYLAVKNFAKYKFLVTRLRALAAISVVWVMSITNGTLGKVGLLQSNLQFLISASVIVSEVAIIILQITTLRLLHRHNNTVAEMMAEGNQPNPTNTAIVAIERQLAKTTSYVVGVLALVFIPMAFGIVITVITKKPYARAQLINPGLLSLRTLCLGINSILYYRGNEKVKQGIFKLVRCL